MALTDNLEAFWKLSDESDASGNGHTLSRDGTPPGVTYVAGKIGDAASFTKSLFTQLYIANAALGGLNFVSDYTISLWFKYTSIGAFETWNLLKTGDFSGGGFELNLSNIGSLSLHFMGGDSTKAFELTSLSTDTWHHFVVGVSANGNNHYQIDGSYAAGTDLVDVAATTGQLRIGNGAEALIDAVGMWSRKLSEAEMTSLWNGGDGIEHPFSGGGGGASNGPINLLTMGCG